MSVVADAQANDLTQVLANQVRRAAAGRTPLRIVGGDTKAFYGRRVGVSRSALRGITGSSATTQASW